MIAVEDRNEIEPHLRLSRTEHAMVIALRERENLNAGEIADKLSDGTRITVRIQQVAAIIYGSVA